MSLYVRFDQQFVDLLDQSGDWKVYNKIDWLWSYFKTLVHAKSVLMFL